MAEEKKEEQKVESLDVARDKEKTENPKPEEKPAEKPIEEPKEKPAPSGKFADLIKDIESLSVLELSELVKELEDRFGVSASMPMVAASGAGSSSDGEAGAAVEEKSKFNVELIAAGDQKINVIKIVREITAVGLKDAKDMVDAAPKIIKENVDKAEAEELKKKLEDAGAQVELK